MLELVSAIGTFALLYVIIGLLIWKLIQYEVANATQWKNLQWWQKVRRAVLFPNKTLMAWLRPHAMAIPLDNTKPELQDVFFFKERPMMYCVFLWPYTILVFVVFVIGIVLSLLLSPFFKE